MIQHNYIETILKSRCSHLNPHLKEFILKKKKSKYGNNKKEVDGILFHSEKEANYYKQLKILMKHGKIGCLELQVPFELNPGGSHSLKYYADFVFVDAETGEKKVIDVKGFRTACYKKKRRLMKKVWGIKITEV